MMTAYDIGLGLILLGFAVIACTLVVGLVLDLLGM